MRRTQVSFSSPVTGPVVPSCEMSAGDCKRADRLFESAALGFEMRCLGGWVSEKGFSTLVLVFMGEVPDFSVVRMGGILNDVLDIFSDNYGTDWQVTFSKEMVAP